MNLMRELALLAAARGAGALLAVLGALAGCSQGVPDTVRIGVPVTLSGPNASRGQDLLNGALLAVEELNASSYKIRGKAVRFEVVPKDDKGEIESVKRVAQELVNENVHAVIGHVNSQQTQAAVPIYAAKGLPHLFTSTNKNLTSMGSGNTFRLVASDQVQAQALASFATETLNANRLVALIEASEYGRDLFADVAVALKKKNKEIVLQYEVDGKQPVSDEIVAKIKEMNGDVVLVLGREGHVLSLMDKLRKLQHTGVTVIAGNGAKTSKVSKSEIPVRGLFATTSTVEPTELPTGREFLSRFQARFKSDPVWGAHYAYDAVYVLADVMRRAESTDGKAVIAKLKVIEPNTRVNFQLRFGASGEQVHPAIGVYKAERGTWVPQMRSANWQ
jgi:branched-chain amino acid transport system substrate-binding protein